MIGSLDPRLMGELEVASSSDLFTLGRYFYEVGGYYDTILSDSTREFADQYDRALSKVLRELRNRNLIEDIDDLYPSFDSIDPEKIFRSLDRLKELSIAELENLYIQIYLSGIGSPTLESDEPSLELKQKVVDELKTRVPATDSDRLKIAYCLDTFKTELEYLTVLSSPES